MEKLDIYTYVRIITGNWPVNFDSATFEHCLTDIDLYNYIEEFTKGFESWRCKKLYEYITKEYEENLFEYNWNPTPKREEMYKFTINILKEHLKPQPKQQSKPEDSSILPDELINKAINAGLIERTENGLRWMKSASLYGYFVDKVSEKLELKSSGGRIQWKVFRFIENHDTLLNTAKQAVNDYTNKRLNPPEGDGIIDKTLKDI